MGNSVSTFHCSTISTLTLECLVNEQFSLHQSRLAQDLPVCLKLSCQLIGSLSEECQSKFRICDLFYMYKQFRPLHVGEIDYQVRGWTQFIGLANYHLL